MRTRTRAAEVDAGQRGGGVRRLRRENAELRRANEILKTASAFETGHDGPHDGVGAERRHLRRKNQL